MSFFGGASAVGGGGFRFSAPSSSSSVTSSTVMHLTTAAGSPPVTIQVLQKSNRPKLQMLFQQINSCRNKAATVVKGTAAQKQFNTQYTSLIGLLAAATKDIDEELFLAVEAQNAAASVSGGGGGGGKLDPKKIPSSVTIHGLAKDLAVFVTSAKGVSLGIPYLEMVCKPAIAAVVEKETAHERTATAASVGVAPPTTTTSKAGENAKKATTLAALQQQQQQQQHQQKLNGAPSSSSSLAATAKGLISGGGGGGGESPRTLASTGALVVGGLPSPLQRGLPSNNNNNSSAPPKVHENEALAAVTQPWLIPYPFSHGTKTERVQAQRVAVAKAQRAGFALQAFAAKHPTKALDIVAKVPAEVLAQRQQGNSRVGGGGGQSPTLGPTASLTSIPAEVALPLVLQHSGLSRIQFYAVAPRVLEICACQTANEMLTKWEQRESVFEIFLNAPSVGTNTLGQISSINASSNPPPTEPVASAAASNLANSSNNGIAIGASNGGGGGGAAGGVENQHHHSTSGVALAMRSGFLGSNDHSQLFLGSPTLKPFHTPPVQPLAMPPPHRNNNTNTNGNQDAMTPLVLAGNDPIFFGGNGGVGGGGEEEPMAPFSLEGELAGSQSTHHDGNGGDLAEYGPTAPSHQKATAQQQPRRRFFPHRCSNINLSSKAVLRKHTATVAAAAAATTASSRASGGGVVVAGGSSAFTVTTTNNNSRHSHGDYSSNNNNQTANQAASGRYSEGLISSGGGGGGGFDFRRSSTSPVMTNGQKRGREDDFGAVSSSPYQHPSMRLSAGGGGGFLLQSPPLQPRNPPPASSSSAGAGGALNNNNTAAAEENAAAFSASLSEPQSFMTVSARVMTCLLHFGVVTTELPMMAAAPTAQGNAQKKKQHHHHHHQQGERVQLK